MMPFFPATPVSNNVFSTPSSTTNNDIHPSLPAVIVDTLMGLNSLPIVYLEIERCLSRQPGYLPDRWNIILHQCGIPLDSIPLLVDMMWANST